MFSTQIATYRPIRRCVNYSYTYLAFELIWAQLQTVGSRPDYISAFYMYRPPSDNELSLRQFGEALPVGLLKISSERDTTDAWI